MILVLFLVFESCHEGIHLIGEGFDFKFEWVLIAVVDEAIIELERVEFDVFPVLLLLGHGNITLQAGWRFAGKSSCSIIFRPPDEFH